MYKITNELINRDYKEEDIEKILGGNLLRVLEKVQDRGMYKVGLEGDIEYLGHELKLNTNRDLDLNAVNSKIIINGITFKTIVDTENSSISYKLDKPLSEKFYVVSFQIDDGINIQRCTRIINTI